ncbi:abc transporter family protein [Stylonychia lemnae]|uniref:Abc transporter family protein n=1 Tax=Stylonychia lemnae TaxID=5949 RepID=A0A078ASL1_STYLE|nr:abc transporter family protein [Stylonychia lemnae]|eukprot:CDW85159.1 abc transporter family protein [Stylonychia lemnae]
MGLIARHYCALMKKNWINWKRTPIASLAELFCPVALMTVLTLFRISIDYEIILANTNIPTTTFFSPPDHLNLTNFTQSYQNAFGLYGKYLNDTGGLTVERTDPVLNFITTACRKTDQDDTRTVIAYSARDNYINSIRNNIKAIQKNQKMYQQQVIPLNIFLQSIQLQNQSKNATEKQNIQKSIDSQKSFNKTLEESVIDFEYMAFKSHDDIIDYIASSDYMLRGGKKGICFGFSVLENGSDDIDVKLIFNGNQGETEARQIPLQLTQPWSQYLIKEDKPSYYSYTKQGFSYMQNWIANIVLREKSGKQNATIAMSIVPFKADEYIKDDYGTVLSVVLAYYLLLMYIIPVYRLIQKIVAEKESKARESMRMMGLTDFSYWLSWFTYYFLIVTIISALCIIILSINVFKYSDRAYIFLYFWVYGMSLFGFCIFLQSFFSTARVAAITGTLAYFCTWFVSQAVADPSVSTLSKNLASLLSTVAVSLGSTNLGLFEINGQGVNSETAKNYYNNYSFEDCIIMMAISFFLFLTIGLYLDNVLPSAFGLRKPWYYFVTRGYWCRLKRNGKVQNSKLSSLQDDSENQSLFEAKFMKRENVEPVSRDLQAQENEDKILKISELKKTFTNGFQAVKGLNIKMYNGQIFALLGHNGAGKTTTISMLTGLIESSSGSAEVFGHDLFNDMDSVRNFLGVCPQHDILFDLLTPEEHLDIFCDFKGVDSKAKKEEIQKILVDVDVYAYKNTQARNLSGGNRRKLSVAIALIGGSKLVLLDEPTSGMDLSARRKLWNMLKNYKNNRIIILTTHYMDEADILGDRIGIMTGGQLICLGGSLFLKNRFGVGYNLTMVKKSKDPNLKIGQFLNEEIGEVRKLSEVSSEITYQIPTALSFKFKDFFPKFDQCLDSLEIRSYGISVTTLEEVFLKVGHGEDPVELQKAKEVVMKQITQTPDKNDDYSVAENHETGTINVFLIHLDAMIRKRIQLYKRNYNGLVVEILIPVLLVLIGLSFTRVRFLKDGPVRELKPDTFPLKQRVQYNNEFFLNSSMTQSWTPTIFMENLPQSKDAFEATSRSYKNETNRTNVIWKFDEDVFKSRLQKPYTPFRFGSYFFYEADQSKLMFKVLTFVNLTSQDVTAYFPQFMYESILKVALSKPNLKFKVSSHPFPVTAKLRNRSQGTNGFFIIFVVAIGFAMIPASVVTFIVNEREKSLKHMQMVSGMSLAAYWVSNIIFDILKAIIPSAIVIGLLYAFEVAYDYVWVLFLIYPLGVIPFSYFTSQFFASENFCQTLTIFVHFVIAGIGGIIAGALRIIEDAYDIGDKLVWAFKIIPSYCLTDSIAYQSLKPQLFQLRPNLIKDDLDFEAVGGDIAIMLVHAGLWTILLILSEAGAFNFILRCFERIQRRNVPALKELNQDDDVIEEENRVEKISPNLLKVRVNKFRKVYSQGFSRGSVAVEKTSFGLEYGECFALLGVNGAGKTTTFKSLTGGITPTSGQVTICGMDILRDFNKVRKLIGYCPQYDAIFPLMTVEDHLYFYARIKGIKKELREELVEKQIKEMNLSEHRKKPAGTLSGGNKRKLSVAICVLGNPPIILLDEPSAGMDPEARRFMWSVVAKISQLRKKSAVILTTHSMEEAEALSTKMGIMVKGGTFKCFGSSQHIKSKYGTGYEIEVKVKKQSNIEMKSMVDQFQLLNRDQIPLSEIEDILRKNYVDDFLVNELRINGLGNDICLEANEHNGMVETRNFINWMYVEQAGMKIIKGLCNDFELVEILEHYNDYYKIRVPRKDKSIGYVFSLIEGKKEEFNISEYSASQTTLEQIFQTFANQKIDGDNILKFHKENGLFSRKKTLLLEDIPQEFSINGYNGKTNA